MDIFRPHLPVSSVRSLVCPLRLPPAPAPAPPLSSSWRGGGGVTISTARRPGRVELRSWAAVRSSNPAPVVAAAAGGNRLRHRVFRNVSQHGVTKPIRTRTSRSGLDGSGPGSQSGPNSARTK